MSVSSFRFTKFPTEVSEQILLHLSGQDIIKMETVSRYFLDLVHGSPILQYRRELFSAGLVDNVHHPRDLAERRKLCRQHMNKWTGTAKVVRRTHKIPAEPQMNHIMALGGDLLALHQLYKYDRPKFLRVPPGGSERPIEGWDIPRLPFEVSCFAAHAPDNLLAIAERMGQIFRIHLLNLLDGSPYGVPPSSQITYEVPPGDNFVHQLAVTGSRVMMHASCENEDEPNTRPVWTIAVWDIKTRDQVLNISTGDGNALIGSHSYVTFLDEFRMLVTNYDEADAAPELVVFDTLITQDHPKTFRQFRFPPWYRCRSPHIRIDCGRPLGTDVRGGPLTADPTQAILAVELTSIGISVDPSVLFAVRTSVLIEHACSIRTNPRIPWEEWVEGAVAVEIPLDIDDFSTFVHGTHMATVVGVDSDTPDYLLYTFDFSKRGRYALQLRSGDSVTERRAVLEDGRKLALEGNPGIYAEDILCPGNGSMVYLDQTGPSTLERGTILHVWEIIGT